VAKGILNISNYSGGINNKTNSRDLQDNQFETLDTLSIETPGKLKIMGAATDYSASNPADLDAEVNYGNGLFHFNADYDIDDTTALLENNEMLFINTDTPNVKVFELNSDKLTYSSRTDITYGDTFSPVVYNAVDGVVRITPTSFQENNKPIKLQYINEQYYMGTQESSQTFQNSGFQLTSSITTGTTYATTNSTDESSDFTTGDIIKFQTTSGPFIFTSNPITLTGVTSTQIQFDAFGGLLVFGSGATILKASNSTAISFTNIGWKKLNIELPAVTESEVKVWNLSTEFIENSGATLDGGVSNETTFDVSDGTAFTIGDLIKVNSEYMHITGIAGDSLTVVRYAWSNSSPSHGDGDVIYYVHNTSWGEVHSIPITQVASNPFYTGTSSTGKGNFNVAFWSGDRPYSNDDTLPDDNSGTFFSTTDSVINIYSEIVYLDNQVSPLKLETTLQSTKANQCIHASLWGRIPDIDNIKSVKFYYSEVKANYVLGDTTQTEPAEDYNKNKIKYLLFEVDFRKGIRYAGGDEYYNADPIIHTSSTKSLYVYPQTIQSIIFSSSLVSTNRILLANIELKDKPENVSAEVYIDNGKYIMGAFGTGYKASTVANRRLYIGNVKYTDPVTGDLKTANDTIFKSNVNAFDTFTYESRIDVEINDGDDIIALESLAGKLLEFKRNHLYIINISRDIEFLEATLEYKGCLKDYHVVRGEGFIAWFNEYGFYLYDGRQLTDLLLDTAGQQRLVWSNYYNVNNVIGYDPIEKTILILNKNQKVIAFDLKARALYYRSKGNSTNDMTNIVTANDGTLVWFDKYDSTNVELRKFSIAPSKLDSQNIDEIALKTKEFTFGKPSVDKKIISVYLSYKNGDGVYLYGFRDDGEEELLATLDGSSETEFKTLHIPLRKAKTEFVDRKAFDKVKGFGLRFSGSNVALDFEVNDIQIIFREKSVK